MISRNTTSCVALIVLGLIAGTDRSNAQGCVAIRQFNPSSTSQSLQLPAEALIVSADYRFFRSFRHFRGTHEEADRVEGGTEVVNRFHGIDFGARYGLTRRIALSVTLPVLYNDRSSLYEHGREERHMTEAGGLGDARLGATFLLLGGSERDPVDLSVGAGLKIPTANAGAEDFFYNVGPDSRGEVRPVDQSIQPGDGGWGSTLELNALAEVADDLSAYLTAFYLLNPRDTNGVRTYRETLNPILANEAIMSVPDQYQARLGLSFRLSPAITASAGMRYEGVPVEDLIGESNGFRRPGSVLSVEPGIRWSLGRLGLSIGVPVAVHRDRPQSVTDLQNEQLSGTPRHGDAAFADYQINVGLSYTLNSGRSGVSRIELMHDPREMDPHFD